ncbi:MAG: UDP-N-acetylmuramoyl-L-alanyl-D-glutamate--2,6-diaminopimelate ligase [Firmicutes bacterium]|nr:UDP-N-acetylmuramoyl-L-alanyl-D-glutamate--2,6-diaminopimelate ligase [Bacillota bacterium]
MTDKMQYTALVSDSRKVIPGCLFFCKGKQFKKEYLVSAMEKGAAAYVSETDLGVDLPCILVPDIRRAMAEYSKDFFGDPSASLCLAGLTGTKGKSTALYFLKSIMERSSLCGEGRFGYLSSIDDYDGTKTVESHLTTPEAIELNEMLANMVKSGIVYAGMEVSSQALKYDRSYGLRFRAGCFTNFSEDHIGPDEHSDIEDYFSSKLKLISQCESFIVNLNSDRAEDVLDACIREKNEGKLRKIICFRVSYPFENDLNEDLIGKAKAAADGFYEAEHIRKDGGLTTFDVSGIGEVSITMPGLFNVENALTAAIFAAEFGAGTEEIKDGLLNARAAGRMEVYRNESKDMVAIVDFAHNEFAFDNIFSSVKQEYPGYRIVAVFGCPGNKAPERRIGMPRSAAKYADYVYVTEDDPFREDPEDICREVYGNLLSFGGKGEIVVNREEAIKKAIENAGEKSVILCLAKGRDTFMHRQEFDPYVSDPVLVSAVLERIK